MNLPTRDEMVAEILARPDTSPTISQMIELLLLHRNEVKRVERLLEAMSQPLRATIKRGDDE